MDILWVSKGNILASAEMSLIISLKWMMRIIDNQVRVLDMSAFWVLLMDRAKATQSSHQNNREGRMEDLSQISREVLQQMRCA